MKKLNKHPLLKDLENELIAGGLTPGTPEFQFKYLERKVEICKEIRGQYSCFDCPYFEHCDLIKSYLTELKYGTGKAPAKKPKE